MTTMPNSASMDHGDLPGQGPSVATSVTDSFIIRLHEATLELLDYTTVAELLPSLVLCASTLLRVRRAEISLLDEGNLIVQATFPPAPHRTLKRVRHGEPSPAWEAIATRQPVLLAATAAGACAQAAVLPIWQSEECLGVLTLGRDEVDTPFTLDELKTFRPFAQVAARVLQNAERQGRALQAAGARATALRESEERFRAVFDQSPLVISLVSLSDGRLVELNRAGQTTFGFSHAEAVGRTSADLNLWLDPDRRIAYFNELMTTGRVSDFEAQFRRRNGEHFTVLCSGTRISIGGRAYSINLIQDITVWKHAVTESERSLAWMRATLESTADGILVVNERGKIETYNAIFAKMWGLEQQPATLPGHSDEIVLRGILDQLVSPEHFLAGIRDLYSRSDDEVLDILHCRDGRIFERFSRPQRVREQPAGRVWSFRNITDRRRAESALRESEERFRVLAEVSPVGIFSADPAGRTLFVNARWSEFAGVPAARAIADGWALALHPDDRDRVQASWNAAIRTHEAWAAEFRFVRPDEAVTWLVGQSRPQKNPTGETTGHVGTLTDVTSLKRTEEARKKLERQLRQSSKMESLGTLAGGIAHDFNNILTGTFGFVDLARLELSTGHPVHAWLDRIAGSSHRARDLVRQILVFSRKDEGVRVSQRLHTVVNDALRMLRSMLPPMVSLEARVGPNTSPVLADTTQVQQVILNLCTNAWHALAPRGGRIIVTLENCSLTQDDAAQHPELRAGPWVRLSVADNGCGMDPSILEHIFEPFFTTRETGAGTGLGLAVVHGIVQSHQGAILVQSAVGVGSTFELYLPPIAEAPDPPDAKSLVIPLGHGERILVVDDDPVSGFAIEKLIETLGYHPRRFTRPEDALINFTEDPMHYDLVVTDLAMPGMNGAELMEHLIRIRPSVPIIVITGYIEPARVHALEGSAARAILHKPVARAELATIIARHLPIKG
jgi:PAS domain S-box-containing protein